MPHPGTKEAAPKISECPDGVPDRVEVEELVLHGRDEQVSARQSAERLVPTGLSECNAR